MRFRRYKYGILVADRTTHRHRETDINKQTGRQSDRQTDRQNKQAGITKQREFFSTFVFVWSEPSVYKETSEGGEGGPGGGGGGKNLAKKNKKRQGKKITFLGLCPHHVHGHCYRLYLCRFLGLDFDFSLGLGLEVISCQFKKKAHFHYTLVSCCFVLSCLALPNLVLSCAGMKRVIT